MNEFLKAFPKTTNSMPFHVQLAGITYPDANYRIERNNSDVSVIEYIIDGMGYVTVKGRTHCVSKDTIYFLEKGEDHCYYSDEERPFEKIFLNISGSFCQTLVSEYNISRRNFFSGEGLKSLFERIIEIIRSPVSDNEMQSALQGLFIEIISRLSFTQSEEMYSREALELKNYLDSNLGHIVSADELSGVIYRSDDYCLKLFKKEFGITPYAYQIERKIQVSKSLLLNTNMSVGEIADTLGYVDLHYFSNLFLKKCGCRPLKYRKNNF